MKALCSPVKRRKCYKCAGKSVTAEKALLLNLQVASRRLDLRGIITASESSSLGGSIIRTTMMIRIIGAVVAAATLTGAARQSRTPTRAGDWVSYGGTNRSQKYSPLDQITRDNVKDLKVAWTWTSPDHELLKRIPVRRDRLGGVVHEYARAA